MATISFERSILVDDEKVANKIADILNSPVSSNEKKQAEKFTPEVNKERQKKIKLCLSHYKN